MDNKIILGIDEVGRGPWAGPLVVGAVILGEAFDHLRAADQTPSQDDTEELSYLWQHLADSKALSPKQRELLAPLIRQHASGAATGWVTARELDQYGLSASLKLATRRAVKQLLGAKIPFTEIIIDGTVNFLKNTPLESRVTTLKKADALIKEVSAAAILAKVERDAYMTNLQEKYPEYGFASHVGYGTAAHLAALKQYGVCPEHRQSFRPIQAFLGQSANQNLSKQTNQPYSERTKHPSILAGNQAQCSKSKPTSTTTRGQAAESAVARYLEAQGHTIVARNYKTKTYEIDLISTHDDCLYFTEVKYSHNPDLELTPLTRITPEKQRQMCYAAEAFLAAHPCYSNYKPALAAAAVTGIDFTVEAWFTID